jgi:hypothetical protein
MTKLKKIYKKTKIKNQEHGLDLGGLTHLDLNQTRAVGFGFFFLEKKKQVMLMTAGQVTRN